MMNQPSVPAGFEGGLVKQSPQSLALSHPNYVVKRSFWAILGRVTRVFAPDGSLAVYIKAKAFTFKSEMTLYADEGETQPMIKMKARQAIGFKINHDVFDPQTQQRLCSVRNRGIGFFKDAWDVLDANDQVIGEMLEGDGAFLRRLFPILRNGKWDISIGGHTCARIREVWRFFAKEYTLDVSMNDGRLDPRVAMACTVLALNRESAREQK
jgi:hypothetical protein